MINAERYYLRNPDVVVVGTAEHYLFIQNDGSVVELPTPSPAQWSRLLQTLIVPTRGEALHRQLADSRAIDTIRVMDLDLLCEQGVLLEAPTASVLETRRACLFTNHQSYH